MTATRDTWHADAMKRLTMHVMRDTSGRDYAPDSRYDAKLRAVVPGPLAVHIADCLHRWARMWAQDAREAKAAGIEFDQDAQWAENMRRGIEEIDRYLAVHKLRGAA